MSEDRTQIVEMWAEQVGTRLRVELDDRGGLVFTILDTISGDVVPRAEATLASFRAETFVRLLAEAKLGKLPRAKYRP